MILKKKLNDDATDLECDQCGVPLRPGGVVYVNDTTGFFCTENCAKRYESGYIDRED